MLKYVAIIHMTNRIGLGEYRSGSVHWNTKSPTYSERKDAKKWIENNIRKYPEAEYFAHYGIIAFDENESTNAEEILEKLIYIF